MPRSADSDELAFARAVLEHESAAVSRLGDSLDERFAEAVGLIEACAERGGTVLVSGLGKSGLIGQKISATLASLGIPSHAVHPTEAAHGDLGRFRSTDICLCLSMSGETEEVVNLAAILRQDNLSVIAITGERDSPSSLEGLAKVTLHLPVKEEAGGGTYIAPTSSTTATLALGDALALCAARRRNFTTGDFAKRHPGGSLGGQLRAVTDVLRTKAGENLPLIPDQVTLGEALRLGEAEGRRRSGAMLLIAEQSGKLSGIFTDGDLRRHVSADNGALDKPMADLMTKDPRVLKDTALVRDAVTLFREFRQDEIPVIDAEGRPVGLLDVQDLITLRLVSD